jgi:NitT/TauT family transport system permease protein
MSVPSIPVLVFFPAALSFFVALGGTNVAAIVIMALSMLWNILFSVTSGLRLIPPNVRALGTVFRLGPLAHFFRILLPALFPSLVTGSLLAWAEGWNMLMVAEVVHTYIPNGSEGDDLFGIGTLMVHATTSGDSALFTGAVGALVLTVLCMNVIVWQPLLRASERFRFE